MASKGGMGVDVWRYTAHVLAVAARVAVAIGLVDPVTKCAKDLPAAPARHKSTKSRFITPSETYTRVGASMVQLDVAVGVPSVGSSTLMDERNEAVGRTLNAALVTVAVVGVIDVDVEREGDGLNS